MSKPNKKRKISVKKIFIFIFIICIIGYIYKLFNIKISNIYIRGNNYLTDQNIIDIAQLNNYPSSISNLSYNIEKKLQKNIYILEANVKKNLLLNEVYINIKENYPLFYYSTKGVTILYNGDEVKDNLSNLTVINSMPSDIYNSLLLEFQNLNVSILNRISEIEYSPTDVLKDRFFLLMNDGNYVYITLNKLKNLNKYLDIIKEFDGKKGILYLDSGKYFDVFDN